ncbi:MAG: tRNA (adenosine(37)-N6)-dimethylallyltransferase MiaA [Sulfuricurvum sp.]
MKTVAIIGSTASGKSDLALSLACRHNANILSIDSLSIYRGIDIASAKPTKEELATVPHFGIDRLSPDQPASVMTFIDEYYRAREQCRLEERHLIIVGGSSFYLKSMLEGLSEVPAYTPETLLKTRLMLQDLPLAYRTLYDNDPVSMAKIHPTDAYRIEKMALIFCATGLPPALWFQNHPPKPVLTECPVFEIRPERSLLRERISLRTHKMVKSGLIDEVAELERLYGRSPNSMKAIGIIETLDYLDGKYSRTQLIEAVTTHTSQLAKRQQTFNATQFNTVETGTADELFDAVTCYLQES